MIPIIVNTEMMLCRSEETLNVNLNLESRSELEKCRRADSTTSHIHVRLKSVLQLKLNKESVLIRIMEFPPTLVQLPFATYKFRGKLFLNFKTRHFFK
jgi:hypothetical protein